MPKCILNEKVVIDLSIEKMCDDWNDIICKSFSIRHKVIHDANFRPDVDIEFIQKAEALFLIIPQIATYVISSKFNLNRLMINCSNKTFEYIINMEDILANDWQVVE